MWSRSVLYTFVSFCIETRSQGQSYMLAEPDTIQLTQIEPRIVSRREHRKRFLSKGSARQDKLSIGLEVVPILFHYGIHPAGQM